MPSPEESLRLSLSTDPGVIALVGDKIYPDELPQEQALPAVVYGRVSTEPIYTLNNTHAATRSRLQAVCWARRRNDAETLADAVMVAALVDGYPTLARSAELDPTTEAHAVTLEFDMWH